jgi:ABC-type transporter Mla maintaining outer membrane lipid asymmetry ATPase subunit MlaF
MPDRIDLEEVSFAYGAVPLLRAITLTINKGEIVVIGGRSGQGMSTLLELCAGLLKPLSGRVLWDGREIAALPKEGLLLLRQTIGYVFQVHALISNLLVFDNIALPLRNRPGAKEDDIGRRVRAEMETLRITGIDSRYPEALSAYECKAVALARALVGDPAFLILDAPLSGIDPAAAERLLAVIEKRWREQAMAVIMMSHDLSVWPHLPARRMILDNGTLAPCRGEPAGGAGNNDGKERHHL